MNVERGLPSGGVMAGNPSGARVNMVEHQRATPASFSRHGAILGVPSTTGRLGRRIVRCQIKTPWQAYVMAQSSSLQRAIRLEVLSIGWALVEAVGSLVAGTSSGSLALVAFGADSGIEMVSAALVLVQLRGNEDKAAIQRSLKGVAILFFALALYVIVAAFVSLRSATHPDSSALGVILAASSVVFMPLLARAKASAGSQLDAEGSTLRGRLLAADAAETALCAVLGVSTLLGVVASTYIGWWWADPIASLMVVYFAIREGREAWHGAGE